MRSFPEILSKNYKKILLRVDFDVPASDGKIAEKFRIEKQKPAIDRLLENCGVVMIAHIKDGPKENGKPSFKPLLQELESVLGHKINFIDDPAKLNQTVVGLKPGELYLLENLRNWPGEEENDTEFAKNLSTGFDVYANNAFAVCHREHASVSAVTHFLTSYPGPLVQEETAKLQEVIDMPKEGKIIVIGGAKAETKVPVVKNFTDKAEKILLGGVVANDILKEKGVDIGTSMSDANSKELLFGLDLDDTKLVLPEDFNIFESKIYDIGPKTVAKFSKVIKNSKIVIWNGPLGLFEDPRFSAGTDAVGMAVVSSGGYKVIGGGDTISAVDHLGIFNKLDFVSTGGGAMLEFLAGKRMPGLEALGYYK